MVAVHSPVVVGQVEHTLLVVAVVVEVVEVVVVHILVIVEGILLARTKFVQNYK